MELVPSVVPERVELCAERRRGRGVCPERTVRAAREGPETRARTTSCQCYRVEQFIQPTTHLKFTPSTATQQCAPHAP